MNPRSGIDPDSAAETQRPSSGSDFLARLRASFQAAIEVPGAERDAWIGAHVADAGEREALQRLLDSDGDESGFFETPATEHVAGIDTGDADPIPADSLIGTQVGAFRLVRLIGKGGMAAVFLGEREGGDFRQRAAVKLLRRGLYSEVEQRLFQRERRVLAALAHPHIAHLIDGGVTGAGVPYLVMEYVDGVPVTRYAAEHRLGVRERIELFLTICRSVEAAHRSLIVHRDIKPSNILVTNDGLVKLLDFGIAKLIEDDNDAPTVAAFTPEYAAPEQLAGEPVTTATDVHALGLLLYELLLGARAETPLARRPSSRAGNAAHAAAAPPRVLERALRGDLDNILLRALEAEPARRYASAGALADDIERYLAGRPVEAHPPSRWYRARKFVRRHRGGVAITAALVLAVFAALALALWQANIARRHEMAARHEAQRANAVRDFIVKLFEPVSEGVAEDKRPSLSDLVAAGSQRLQTASALGAAERVDLTIMFSRLQAHLGEFARARELADAADDLARATLDPLHPKAIEALELRGERRVRDGDDDAGGEAPLREAVRRLQAAGLGGPTLVSALDNLSVVEMDRDHPDESLALAQRALDERRRLYGADGKQTATGYNNLGYGLVGVGRFEEAVEAYRHTFEIDRRFRDPGSYDVLSSLSNWGYALAQAGHSREARARFAAVDEGLRKLGGKPRGTHVVNAQKLCLVDVQISAPEVSERSCLRALEMAGEVAATSPQSLASAQVIEAGRLLGIGQKAAARTLLETARSAYPDAPESAHERGLVLALRAEIDWLDGDAAAARRDALEGHALLMPGRDSRTATIRAQGVLLLACRHAATSDCPDRLEADFENALAELATNNDPRLLLPRLIRARVLIERGAADEAATYLAQVIEQARTELGAEHPAIATAQRWRAFALENAGACAEARDVLATLASEPSTDAAGAPAHAVYPWLAEARAALATSNACRAE